MPNESNVYTKTEYQFGFECGMNEALSYVMDIVEKYGENGEDLDWPSVMIREMVARCKKRLGQ